MKKINLPFDALGEKIAALTPLHKGLIVGGTLVALGALFYFLSYKPHAENIQRLQQQVSQQEQRLNELKKAAREVKRIQQELAESEKKLEELLTLLPDQKEIPSLLENVSQLGAQEGLENALFQPQAEQDMGFYATIPVRLDLVGTYHKLGEFFDKISKLDRILKVEGLNMTRSGSGIRVNCTVVTYRFLEKAEEKESPDAKDKKKKK